MAFGIVQCFVYCRTIINHHYDPTSKRRRLAKVTAAAWRAARVVWRRGIMLVPERFQPWGKVCSFSRGRQRRFLCRTWFVWVCHGLIGPGVLIEGYVICLLARSPPWKLVEDVSLSKPSSWPQLKQCLFGGLLRRALFASFFFTNQHLEATHTHQQHMLKQRSE